MSTPNQPISRKKKVLGALGTAGAFGVMIAWYILSGGQWGGKDFSGQDLRDQGDRFRRADMVDANFSEANISGLEMLGVQLHRANLAGVIAEGTVMPNARFIDADLTGANLRGANLIEADFTRTDLTGADLRGADIRGANFDATVLDDADLRNVMTGPYCPSRRGDVPDWCPDSMGGDNCCAMHWENRLNVEGTQVCRTPWWELFREAADAAFGVVGTPIYDDVETFDNGRHICTETPPPTP